MSRSKPKAAPAEAPAPEPQIAATTGATDPATPQGPDTTAVASAPASAAAEAAPAAVVPQTDVVSPAAATDTDGNPPSDLAPGQDGGAAAQQPASAGGHVLRIKGPAKGRWRAGRHFTPELVDIPAAELTEDEIKRLMDDPELTVLVVGEA